MKKSLIALSVAAAVSSGAQAQNVSITGIMDSMYLSGKWFGQGYKEIGQSGARTTSVMITGGEDLGGGLRANFRFEVQPLLIAGDGNRYAAVPTTGTGNGTGAAVANGSSQTFNQASRQSGLTGSGYNFVGLSGGFGAVEFGTINSPSFRVYALGAGGLGTGIGSGYNGGHGILGSTGAQTFTRFENAVMYTAPVFNDITFRALMSTGNNSQYGTNSATTLRRIGVMDYSLTYASGPLQIAGSIMTRKNSPNESSTNSSVTTSSVNVETTTTTLAGRYNLGFAAVGATVQNITNNAGATTGNGTRANSTTGKLSQEAYAVNVTVPMGAVRLMGNIGSRVTNESPINILEGLKTSFTGLAAEYDLSKRTFLYARYETGKAMDVQASTIVTNGVAGANADSGVADGRFSRLGLGISHQF